MPYTAFDPFVIAPVFMAPPGPPATDHLPLFNRGLWQDDEDERLREAVRQYGVDQWECVASLVTGRSPTQCRERWTFRLCPGLNKAPFQPWEDDVIKHERERIGNHWKVIAEQLPGRCSCAVKNRWYAVLRKQSEQSAMRCSPEAFSVSNLLARPPPFVSCPPLSLPAQ
jgi:hypothetical protein